MLIRHSYCGSVFVVNARCMRVRLTVVGGANFRGKPSELIFVVLNFMTQQPSPGVRCCANDDVIDTHAMMM
jgi:hypothetical protein